MKARKKPIDVMAIHYTHNIDLDKLLELLRTNKEEPVRYEKTIKQFISKKNVAKLR